MCKDFSLMCTVAILAQGTSSWLATRSPVLYPRPQTECAREKTAPPRDRGVKNGGSREKTTSPGGRGVQNAGSKFAH